MNSLFARGKLLLSEDCTTLSAAPLGATWKKDCAYTRLDDGSTDIDSRDAFEYCIKRERL